MNERRFKVLIIFGTRPEVIKLAPLIKIFQERYANEIEAIPVNVAQHREMVDQLIEIFGISPRFDLNIMKAQQSLTYITTQALNKLTELYEKITPDYVVIQGDTTTAMAASLAAFYQRIPLGHVEAGLRTRNRFSPFPEEINRRVIGVLAYHHFAPTKKAYENLLREGVEKDSIFLTGNTVIDAVMKIMESGRLNLPVYVPSDKKIILVTAHRRENWGNGLKSICRAVKRLVLSFEDIHVVFPVHLNPAVRKTVFEILENVPGIKLVEPLNYLELLSVMQKAYLVMTDSGGIQEEAPAMGKPVLVLRNTTERPEGVEAGVALLVGTDEEKIYSEAASLIQNKELYETMARRSFIYGDGKASERIAKIISDFLLHTHSF